MSPYHTTSMYEGTSISAVKEFAWESKNLLSTETECSAIACKNALVNHVMCYESCICHATQPDTGQTVAQRGQGRSQTWYTGVMCCSSLFQVVCSASLVASMSAIWGNGIMLITEHDLPACCISSVMALTLAPSLLCQVIIFCKIKFSKLYSHVQQLHTYVWYLS